MERHDIEDASDDETVRYSIYWLLGVIGEASRHVSVETRSKLSLPWSKMVALRNRLAHGYFDISLEIAYRTAHDDVPTLIEPLRTFLSDAESSPES